MRESHYLWSLTLAPIALRTSSTDRGRQAVMVSMGARYPSVCIIQPMTVGTISELNDTEITTMPEADAVRVGNASQHRIISDGTEAPSVNPPTVTSATNAAFGSRARKQTKNSAKDNRTLSVKKRGAPMRL